MRYTDILMLAMKLEASFLISAGDLIRYGAMLSYRITQNAKPGNLLNLLRDS